MESLSLTGMINYPAAHLKYYSPVTRGMTGVKALSKPANKAISNDHWDFCHTILPKVSVSFADVILQLPQPRLRDSICNLFLMLRCLDNIEDDMKLPVDVRMAVLRNFHYFIHDKNWKFICGNTDMDRELMQGHHQYHAAFMDLETSSQDIIADVTKKMGEGMAKFTPIEIKTMDDWDEYIDIVNTTWITGTMRLAESLVGEPLPEYSLIHSIASLHQKRHTIQGYYEDIIEVPKKKMYWPEQTWSKYVEKIEDLQHDEVNSVKAVQLVNEMVTDVLSHAEGSFGFTSGIQDPGVFRIYALLQIMSIGELALCYNNIQVFRKDLKLRADVKARIINRTKTMADVYGAFYDVSCLMKSKVNDDDPLAAETLSRLEAIKQICVDSKTLKERNVIFESIQDIM
ncbi:squalene synthase 8-like [Apium graveolens]|uniref:squalene synthase 8-like n=1 Tax=Apium graveolens TaxID=4045 RepID=UPI003D7A69BB